MFQEVQYGAGNPIYWQPRTSTVNNGSDFVNSTTTNDAISLIYILITLGSTDKPLPVELISFTATCNGSKNTLTWKTASETNNKGFEVEKSSDAQEWEPIGFVEGHGNSNTLLTYSFDDLNPYFPTTYYRLIQIDNDGNTKNSNIISANCTHQELTEEDFNPIIQANNLIINIKGMPQNNYKFIVTNTLGQAIISKSIILNEINETVILEKPIAAGIYYISMISKNTFISKPVFIK
jgi:hypothetical protein